MHTSDPDVLPIPKTNEANARVFCCDPDNQGDTPVESSDGAACDSLHTKTSKGPINDDHDSFHDTVEFDDFAEFLDDTNVDFMEKNKLGCTFHLTLDYDDMDDPDQAHKFIQTNEVDNLIISCLNDFLTLVALFLDRTPSYLL
jgi:hypothetical protein